MSNVGRRNRKNGKSKLVVVIISTAIVLMALFAFGGKIKSSFDPVSIVANVTATEFKETDGRTNVLILGSDRRNAGVVSSELTDTILVASIGKLDNDVVLISVPRDLWVKLPSGGYERINAVYTLAGMEDLKAVLEEVLGIPIHYHTMVTFELFQEAINIVGGVEIDVETAFQDYEYPIEGKENDTCGRTEDEIKDMTEKEWSYLQMFPCRYETVSFSAGKQTMDGIKALKYARSRHGNNGETSDFSRAKRQQKVIMAIKNKALSADTLLNPSKIKDLYDLYSEKVDTNIDLGTVQNFYLLSKEIQFDKVTSVVLDDSSEAETGGLLYHPTDSTLYGGRYVLIPQTGDYSQIHAFVQRYLFGNK